jgi:hypothetical protein
MQKWMLYGVHGEYQTGSVCAILCCSLVRAAMEKVQFALLCSISAIINITERSLALYIMQTSYMKHEPSPVKQEAVDKGQKRHAPANADDQPAASRIKTDPDSLKAEANCLRAAHSKQHILQ